MARVALQFLIRFGAEDLASWAVFGLCRGQNRIEVRIKRQNVVVNPWFPRNKSEYNATHELAEEACGACVVREQCDQFATVSGQTWGIWGGELRGYDRLAMLRDRSASDLDVDDPGEGDEPEPGTPDALGPVEALHRDMAVAGTGCCEDSEVAEALAG